MQKFQDLKAKRIGVAEGGIAWMMFVMLLEKNGMTYNDIQAANFSAPTDMVNAIKRGDMDAVDLWEPFVTQTVVEGYANISPVVNYNETPPWLDERRPRGEQGIRDRAAGCTGRGNLRVVLKSEQQIEKDHQIWVDTRSRLQQPRRGHHQSRARRHPLRRTAVEPGQAGCDSDIHRQGRDRKDRT